MTQPDPPLSCTSWNLHRGRGNDGVIDPCRTLRVLGAEVCPPGADALVLQEADEEVPPHRGFLDLAAAAAVTGLEHVHTDAARRWGPESHGFLGTIVFLHRAAHVEDVVLLDLPGRCHRGAVVVDFTLRGRALRLIGTHLSLAQVLRAAQMRTIGQHLFRRAARPVVLCGDLNEWRPWGGLALSRRVTGVPLEGPAPATFPVGRPVLPLDRVLVTPPARVASVRVLDGPGIRMASDHRPLAAEIALPDQTPPSRARVQR
jgi:endonuclease/exonuclease/phosphatase family metal-dependent hydrolase